MQKFLLSVGSMVVGIVLAAGTHPVRAAAILTIADQNDEFTITHSNLPLTVTGTGTGTGTNRATITQGDGDGDQASIQNFTFGPVSITQGNGNNDIATLLNLTIASATITQGNGLDDVIHISPESMIGGVLNFSGTWTLSAGTTATIGSFAEVAFGLNGLVSDLLTWTVASAGVDEASISGTFCANLGTGSFPCTVPTNAVTVGAGPDSFANQDLTATFITDRAAAIPEPASMAVFGTALLGFGVIRRRRRDG
jgi:hypothetical protein